MQEASSHVETQGNSLSYVFESVRTLYQIIASYFGSFWRQNMWTIKNSSFLLCTLGGRRGTGSKLPHPEGVILWFQINKLRRDKWFWSNTFVGPATMRAKLSFLGLYCAIFWMKACCRIQKKLVILMKIEIRLNWYRNALKSCVMSVHVFVNIEIKFSWYLNALKSFAVGKWIILYFHYK